MLKEDLVSLYEFTFIAQPNLLQHEVEEMIQEFSVLLNNIQANVISQEVKDLIVGEHNSLTREELEIGAERISKGLIVYSNFLESLIRILWVELEEDFSNLKEVESKIDTQFRNQLSDVRVKQNLIDLPKYGTKSTFVFNIVNAYRKNISQHLTRSLLEVLKDLKITDSNQLNKTVELLLSNIKASGLIKYEYWGLLDFAYPINKMKSGHYCMMYMSFTSSIMDEFERRVKLNENVIRYLSIRVNEFLKSNSYMMNKQVDDKSA